MKFLRFFLIAGALMAAATVFGQSATLTADTTTLQSAGGVVTLTATTTYTGQPAALGWSIELPGDWTLVSVSGPNQPQVAPPTGSAGTLEFAFTTSPSDRAVFSVTVQYPAGINQKVAATPTVILRADGKATTMHPQSVVLAKTPTDRPADK